MLCKILVLLICSYSVQCGSSRGMCIVLKYLLSKAAATLSLPLIVTPSYSSVDIYLLC